MLRSLIDPNDAPRALFCPTPRARDTEKSHPQAQKAPEAAPRGASAPDTPRRCRGRSSCCTALPGTPSNFESPRRPPIASAVHTCPCPADPNTLCWHRCVLCGEHKVQVDIDDGVSSSKRCEMAPHVTPCSIPARSPFPYLVQRGRARPTGASDGVSLWAFL